MKKEEYINHLVQSLKPYDKVYTEEIIRDYEEYFQCKSADIKVVPSKDALFHVYTEDPDDMKYLEHTWEGTSYFGRVKTGKKGTLSGFVESLLGSMTEIILEIPDEIEKLHIESSNGDINLKKIKCENITLKTVNG